MGTVPGLKWLQHGSSAAGLAILAVWAGVRLARSSVHPTRRRLPGWIRWSWWLSLPLLLGGALVWGLVTIGPLTDEWTPAHLGYFVLPPACAAWGLLTVVLALGHPGGADHTRPARRSPAPAPVIESMATLPA